MLKITLLAAILISGCLLLEAAPRGVDAEFDRLAAEYTAGYLAWRPQTGVTLGFHEYDGQAPDYSAQSIVREFERLKTFEQRLAKLRLRALSRERRHDAQLLLGAIRREIFTFEDQQAYAQNPMVYAGSLDISIYLKRDFAPFEQRVRSMVAILAKAPAILAAARANLEDSLPRPHVETAIEIANGAADFLAKDFTESVKGVENPNILAAANIVGARAVAELRQFAAYLKREKLPRSHEQYALGREKYARLLQCGEMIALAPAELLALGEQELRREQERFAQTAAEIDPAHPAIEVFKTIQKDHPTEASLIADTKKNLENIRQFIVQRRLLTLPSEVRARVEETPAFLRATSFASMDTPGPFETKATEAFYYVTPVEPDWPAAQKEEWLTAFNYYTTDIVSIHEAYPGHYAQFLRLNASAATRMEKIFTSYAFVEGWAHYAEQMMVEQGFGGGDAGATNTLKQAKYRLAQSDEALLRLCRFCVSIRMHCFGMTIDQAAEFFQDNCYYEAKPSRAEAVRGAYDPEYLYYTLGKLELLKLREDYRRQEKSAFKLKTFHDEILRHGAPPVRLLRECLLKKRKIWDEVLPVTDLPDK